MFPAGLAHADTIRIDNAIIVLIDISRLEATLGKVDCSLVAIIPEGISERVLRSGGRATRKSRSDRRKQSPHLSFDGGLIRFSIRARAG